MSGAPLGPGSGVGPGTVEAVWTAADPFGPGGPSGHDPEPLPHFGWAPDYSASARTAPRVSKVEFGDGYAQRMGRGLNTMLETVSLTFSGRTDGEAEAILAFLAERGGHMPFTARIGVGPAARLRKYVTEGEWTRTWDAYSDNTVTVTFQEVP